MLAEREQENLTRRRSVPAVFGSAQVMEDPGWEWEFAAHLKASHSVLELLAMFSRYRNDESPFESQLRRILFRAMCRQCLAADGFSTISADSTVLTRESANCIGGRHSPYFLPLCLRARIGLGAFGSLQRPPGSQPLSPAVPEEKCS